MVHASKHVVVTRGQDAISREQAEGLAHNLGLTVVHDNSRQHELSLGYEHGILELRDGQTKPGHGIFVDFSTLHPHRAMQRGGLSRNQALARAVGKDAVQVLDATAGLGHDAALLACMGYHVTAVERSPILAALLADGLSRALKDPELFSYFENRLRVVNTDARDFLQAESGKFDSIYIDPMFPPKRKTTALAKKSIRLVRALVGDDADAQQLLEFARQQPVRIAVKRPTHAHPLAPGFVATIASKLVRYDIYKGVSDTA
jgi:16S rRNA (guanine1516-N2)-methyltransferase